jgi:hypothetical protein
VSNLIHNFLNWTSVKFHMVPTEPELIITTISNTMLLCCLNFRLKIQTKRVRKRGILERQAYNEIPPRVE